MYKIEYARDVEKSLLKIPKKDAAAIIKKIESLQANPRPEGIESLKGEWADYFRVRIGNYRVIYSIHDKILIIYVLKVAKRGEVYRKK